MVKYSSQHKRLRSMTYNFPFHKPINHKTKSITISISPILDELIYYLINDTKSLPRFSRALTLAISKFLMRYKDITGMFERQLDYFRKNAKCIPYSSKIYESQNPRYKHNLSVVNYSEPIDLRQHMDNFAERLKLSSSHSELIRFALIDFLYEELRQDDVYNKTNANMTTHEGKNIVMIDGVLHYVSPTKKETEITPHVE